MNTFILVTMLVVIVLAGLFAIFKIKLDEKGMNEMLDKSSKALDEAQRRVRELEDGVKRSFGVSVRNEITKVDCSFDKLEMVIMMAGVYKLVTSSGDIDDKETYIKLYKKIQSFTEQMEENPNG